MGQVPRACLPSVKERRDGPRRPSGAGQGREPRGQGPLRGRRSGRKANIAGRGGTPMSAAHPPKPLICVGLISGDRR
jgi:hypothetical protein